MAGRWNLWCMVTMYRYGYSGCCCKEVYTDILTIIFNFPYFTCIILFFFIFKMFFYLVYVIFVQYIVNVIQRTFEIVKKNRDHANIIIKLLSIIKERRTCVDGARARVSRLPRTRYRMTLPADSVYQNGAVELAYCMSDGETSI